MDSFGLSADHSHFVLVLLDFKPTLSGASNSLLQILKFCGRNPEPSIELPDFCNFSLEDGIQALNLIGKFLNDALILSYLLAKLSDSVLQVALADVFLHHYAFHVD